MKISIFQSFMCGIDHINEAPNQLAQIVKRSRIFGDVIDQKLNPNMNKVQKELLQGLG